MLWVPEDDRHCLYSCCFSGAVSAPACGHRSRSGAAVIVVQRLLRLASCPLRPASSAPSTSGAPPSCSLYLSAPKRCLLRHHVSPAYSLEVSASLMTTFQKQLGHLAAVLSAAPRPPATMSRYPGFPAVVP
ncbi:hypothetical protein NN561_003573 [Cricetulus griseus]